MAYTKGDRADSPMKRRGGRRRKKVCVFCGKENNEDPPEKNYWHMCKTPESTHCSD